MNNYTIYKHIFPNNKIYIGITNQKPSNRWKNGNGYKKQSLIFNAINKYGWEEIQHIILFTNLNKKEAEEKEIYLISKYKSNDRQYGYNVSNGGNTIGTHSEETKMKISIGNRKPKMRGWHRSEETKEKYRTSKLGNKNPNYGKKLTQEEIENICLYTRKKVIQYDKNMNVINNFKGVREAGRMTNRGSNSVSHSCINGNITKDGFYFKFNN